MEYGSTSQSRGFLMSMAMPSVPRSICGGHIFTTLYSESRKGSGSGKARVSWSAQTSMLLSRQSFRTLSAFCAMELTLRVATLHLTFSFLRAVCMPVFTPQESFAMTTWTGCLHWVVVGCCLLAGEGCGVAGCCGVG